MLLFRAIALSTLLVMLASCGFQPLYGRQTQNAKVTAALEQTYVLPMAGRTGQIVRNSLLDKVTPKGVPARAKYQLQVSLSELKQGLAIDQSNSTNRFNLTLKAKYTLFDATGKQPIYRGSAQSVSSYNIVDSDFANLAAEKNAQKRSALVISEEIHRQLSVFLSR